MITIQNTVTKYVEQKGSMPTSTGSGEAAGKGPMDKASCNWRNDGDQMQKFFDTVAELLLKVSDCEMAMVCGNYIVKTLPMGGFTELLSN